MSVFPVISTMARMPTDEPMLRTDGRAVESDRSDAAEMAGRSRRSWPGQSAIRLSLELWLSPGREHKPRAAIADPGYDADELVQEIHRRAAHFVIPVRRHRKQPRKFSNSL